MNPRIGLLGCGRIGAMHAELISRRVDGAVLGPVFDVVPDAAEALAARLGTTTAGSVDDILSDASVDAVAICTSTETHVDLIIGAARAGKSIFCEKPLSMDLGEIDRALAVVDEVGAYLQVGFNRRFDPSHRAVAQGVADGSIGDPHLIRITSRDPEPPPISYIEGSGGIFLDMTIHDFDMARYVVRSEVVTVHATGGVRVDPAIGEVGDIDTAVVVLTHQDGTITTIDNSRRAVYGYDQRVEAFGSSGMIASHNVPANTTIASDLAGRRGSPLQHFFLERYEQSYLEEWKEFISSIATGSASPVDGKDGRAPLVMGLAAWKSYREARPVDVDEIDPS